MPARIAELAVHYTKGAGRFDHAITAALEEAFETILCPSPVRWDSRRLRQFVERSVPLDVQMLWSPKKHWKLGAESSIDLAELTALQTLISGLTSIAMAVR